MVRLAENPSLRDASCCRVEVVKGGAGRRRTRLVSIFDTAQSAARMRLAVCIAMASSVRLILFSLLPSKWVMRAVRLSSFPVWKIVSTDQYSCAVKASISASRWQIRRKATDCTRPAEREPGSLRHKTGEMPKPIRWSRARRARYASTRSISSSRGSSIAFKMALLVISLKTTRSTGIVLALRFSFSSSQTCQLIASPSLSGSVARISLSAPFKAVVISFIRLLPCSDICQLISKSFSV